MLPFFVSALWIVGQVPEPGPLNEKVLEFARSKLGEQVGDGVCSSLVADALGKAGAVRSRRGWGLALPSWKEAQPGDILVFEDAVFVHRSHLAGGGIYTRTDYYPRHVAIVSEVRKRGRSARMVILHQNADFAGETDVEKKKVKTWNLDSADLRKGSIQGFRPSRDEGPPLPDGPIP